MVLPKLEQYYQYVIDLLNNDSAEEAFQMLRETDLITRNFLQINVYFDDRKVTIYNEKMFMSAAGEYFQKIFSGSVIVSDCHFFLAQLFAFKSYRVVVFSNFSRTINSVWLKT